VSFDFGMANGSATPPGEPGSKRKGVLLPTLVILGVIVVGFVLFTAFYTDWLWFGSVEKTEIFTTTLTVRIALFAIFGLIMGLPLGLVMWWAYRTRPTYRGLTPEQASLERYRMSIDGARRVITIVASLAAGVLAGIAGAGEWQQFLMWRNATDFGQVDPQFGLDLGFYTFTLPFIQFLLGFGFTVLIVCTLAAVVVQYLYGGLRLQPKGDRASAAAQVQISLLIALLLILKAASYWFDRFALVTKSENLVAGFTGLKYTDVNAVLPSLTILTFVALMVAALFIVNIFRRHWALPVLGVGLMLLTGIVVGVIYPMIVQQFQVRPSEQVKETPYIQRNIDATRDAYNIADSQVTDYEGSVSSPSAQTLKASTGTLGNIRLLDPDVVSPTYNQLQQIRGYYAFANQLDIDRYSLDGKERGSVVAVREINLAGIPDGQRNWSNDKLVYTHGYGMVSAYDNTALSNGQPDFYESEIPTTGLLNLEQPRVYFGENSPQYSIVGASKGSTPIELDYPDDASPSGQKTNTYQGTGGVGMGGFFDRLVFATKFQDFNILLSDLVNADSRILWDRAPAQRVEKVAPFLTVDEDSYPIVVDGRIKWVVDAYTTSNDYPYSSRVSLADAISDSSTTRLTNSAMAPTDQLNYMRNSVKAIVDAYDGTVTLYQWDDSDPVLKTWMKAYPEIVVPRSTMPANILEHVRYPRDIFKVQRTILSRYHVTDAATFYNGTDVWIVPFDPTLSPAQVFQPPYYLSLQMPGDTSTNFSLTTTFAPQRRQTLAAFMSVSSDPAHEYGKLKILQLPSNTTIPGPQQVQNNFESDPNVSSQLSLLRRGGSEVQLGNLLSLPFNDGLLYVEPVYIRASTDGYPLLRKVLVGYGSNVAMEDTLDVALAKVFNVSPTAIPEKDPGTNQDPTSESANGDTITPAPQPKPSATANADPAKELALAIAAANAAFEQGQTALRKGDFTAYDTAQKQLEAALKRAAAAQAELDAATA